MIGIYKITNIQNNKVYIGQSTDVEDRIAHHRSSLRHNKHENSHLQRSWNKYGEDSFMFEILDICEEQALDDKERYYIEMYQATDQNHGYNKEDGGSLNKHMSEEQKAKMRKAKEGMYIGENNPMYGVHLKCQEEKKKKLSEMFKGKKRPECARVISEEEKRVLSVRFSGSGNPFYGKHHSDETRKKVRESKRNHPVLCVETGQEYISINEASKQTGIHSASISRASRSDRTAGGFHWKLIAQ